MESVVENVRKFDWPLDGNCRDREAVAREIERQVQDVNLRKVLYATLSVIWPESAAADWRPGDESAVVSFKQIGDLAGMHLNTVRPLIKLAQGLGWMTVQERAGKPSLVGICWGKFFADRGPLQSPTKPYKWDPDRIADEVVGLQPLQELDAQIVGVGGLQSPTNASLWAAFVGLQEQIVALQTRDCRGQEALTAAIERLCGLMETNIRLQMQQTTTAVKEPDPYNGTPTNLEGLEASNPSKTTPYIDIKEIYKYGDLEKDKKQGEVACGDFAWTTDCYPMTREQLLKNDFVERLFSQASSPRGGWPSDAEGRVEFYTLVAYALGRDKSKDGPGRIVTRAVQRKVFGKALWERADSRKTAMRRLTGVPGPAIGPPPKPKSRCPTRDWSEIDERIGKMTNDEVLARLDETWQGEFRKVIAKGFSALHSKIFRDKLRAILTRSDVAAVSDDPQGLAQLLGTIETQ